MGACSLDRVLLQIAMVTHDILELDSYSLFMEVPSRHWEAIIS